MKKPTPPSMMTDPSYRSWLRRSFAKGSDVSVRHAAGAAMWNEIVEYMEAVEAYAFALEQAGMQLLSDVMLAPGVEACPCCGAPTGQTIHADTCSAAAFSQIVSSWVGPALTDPTPQPTTIAEPLTFRPRSEP